MIEQTYVEQCNSLKPPAMSNIPEFQAGFVLANNEVYCGKSTCTFHFLRLNLALSASEGHTELACVACVQ